MAAAAVVEAAGSRVATLKWPALLVVAGGCPVVRLALPGLLLLLAMEWLATSNMAAQAAEAAEGRSEPRAEPEALEPFPVGAAAAAVRARTAEPAAHPGPGVTARSTS